MNGRYDNDPGSDLSAIAALALIVGAIVTGFAFFAAEEGAFPSASGARLQMLAALPSAANVTAQAAPESINPEGIDLTVTSSTMAAADIPACDMELCARAYRSFRPSDCTYQPYDGPRKLCTR